MYSLRLIEASRDFSLPKMLVVRCYQFDKLMEYSIINGEKVDRWTSVRKTDVVMCIV